MIPLMKHAFSHEFATKKALADFLLTSDRLSMGEVCAKFEHAFAGVQQTDFALLFNSGASANLAILQSLMNLGRLRRNDRIGFSAVTWATNVMPIIQLGMIPVPVDCHPETLNSMTDNLRDRLLDGDLAAMFVTNALGFAPDLHAMRDLCHERDIILIEDNCEALGTELGEEKTGNFGVASSFSFFVAHHMSTIEGGMVCTRDPELAEMLTMVRANGWDRNLTAKQQFHWRAKHQVGSEFLAKYTFYDLAYNLRPTEITGFLGLQQLQYLDSNVSARELNYERLAPLMSQNPELVTMDRSHISRLSAFATPVVCRTPELRNKYVGEFAGAGIEVRPMIAGDMQAQPFYNKYVDQHYDLPGARHLHDCAFYCGNYPELTDSDLETISSCLMSRSDVPEAQLQ